MIELQTTWAFLADGLNRRLGQFLQGGRDALGSYWRAREARPAATTDANYAESDVMPSA